ncbi:ABC transporter ATP-binding protein [Leucobacter sp. wl10]|uniref:ABC transporter ATP-binding protein n=1 Tax=Leucobacter sp. wl10 TaxID=2304677 RepID=UPI000E5B6427|nr:ABC transporter ATP-binding protein [Leucobacter sp. wl10]RGE18845.1 ABC transporter ATP-binding protein [Leucobacter sp. wl10]
MTDPGAYGTTAYAPEPPAATGPAASLRGTGISVAFGGATALDRVGIAMRTGAVTALVGPNGSGKSTLLRTLARLLRPNAGTVGLSDVDDAQLLSPKAFARRVSMLAQQRPIPAGITVEDLVGYGRHPHRSGWRGHDEAGASAIERALRLTGLAPLRAETLETLSGGQLQRAWLASALAQDTEVLLLDEPTNHLDLRYQAETLDLIRALADEHGVTVGVVLHDLAHAAEIADVVAIMHAGRVVANDSPPRALTPELLSEVYEIPIEVDEDPIDGTLEIRVRRNRARRERLTPAEGAGR